MTNETAALTDASEPGAISASETAAIHGLHGITDLDALSESEWRAIVARSLQAGAVRMDGMEGSIAINTRMTGDIAQDTGQIREIVQMGRAFFSGLNKFASGCARVWTVLKPIVQAAAILAGAWAAIRGALFGSAPHPPTK